MKTLDEYFPSGRGDGRKFTEDCLGTHVYYEPIFRDRLRWYGLWSSGGMIHICGATQVKEWHPPKAKKKVTIYRPIRKNCDGNIVIYEMWDSDKNNFSDHSGAVGWQTMECEVDE